MLPGGINTRRGSLHGMPGMAGHPTQLPTLEEASIEGVIEDTNGSESSKRASENAKKIPGDRFEILRPDSTHVGDISGVPINIMVGPEGENTDDGPEPTIGRPSDDHIKTTVNIDPLTGASLLSAATTQPKSILQKTKVARVASFAHSFASVGTSVQRHAVGNLMLAADDETGTGLAHFNRQNWTKDEQMRRAKALPIMRSTMKQLDGTAVKRIGSNAGGSISTEYSGLNISGKRQESLDEFGQAFYQELFRKYPAAQDEMFHNNTIDILAMKIDSTMKTLLEWFEAETPIDMASSVASTALRHIEHGVEEHHFEGWKQAMLTAMQKIVTLRGFKWTSQAKRAWNFAISTALSDMGRAMAAYKPRVDVLKESWVFMCDKAVEDKNRRQHQSNRSDTGVPRHAVSSNSTAQKAPLLHGTASSAEASNNTNVSLARLKLQRSVKVMALMKSKSTMAIKKVRQGHLSLTQLPKDLGRAAASRVRNFKESRLQAQEQYKIWSKRETMSADGSDGARYTEGRNLVGKLFLDSMSWTLKEFGLGNKSEHAEQMGQALELLVQCSTKPHILQQRVKALALSHVQMGIRPAHLMFFEHSLFQFLHQVFYTYNRWDKKTEDAWKWMWGIIKAAFTTEMESALNMLDGIERCYSVLLENDLVEKTAYKFYELFFRRSPEMQRWFVKPQRKLAVVLGKTLELMHRSLIDPKVLSTEVKILAMRHIKYDIMGEDLDIYGDSLLATLKDVLGPEVWDDSAHVAWASAFAMISEVFQHIILAGKNTVSRALANSNPRELKEALQAMPRGRRVESALGIGVDDSLLSLVVWTVMEGQLQLTDVILQDLLVIRSDRSHFYNGREELWSIHPWIISFLVEKAPRVLPTFLGGHMWVSSVMENGHRRVNYYIKEMYGDPDDPHNYNPYGGALGTLITKLPLSELHIFRHPVVRYLVDLKWDLFARREFMISQLMNCFLLVSGTVWLLLAPKMPRESLILASAQAAVAGMRCIGQGIVIVRQSMLGNGIRYKIRKDYSIFVPYALNDVFFWLTLTNSAIIIKIYDYTWEHDPFYWLKVFNPHHVYHEEFHNDLHDWANLVALSQGILWLQMAELFKATKELSALLYSFMAIISDVMRFMLVLALWVVGFSMMLYWMLVAEELHEHGDFRQSLVVHLLDQDCDRLDVVFYLVMSCMGLTPIDDIFKYDAEIRTAFAACVMLTVIVLLNLLVATMISHYAKMQLYCEELAVRSRAILVVRAEESMTRSRRRKIFQSLGLNKPCQFMDQDEGPPGGIQVMTNCWGMDHPAFKKFDQLECYGGPSNKNLPFHEEFLVKGQAALDDLDNKDDEHAEFEDIKHSLKDVQADLFMLKRGLLGGSKSDGGTSHGTGTSWGDTPSVPQQNAGEDTGGVSTANNETKPQERLAGKDIEDSPKPGKHPSPKEDGSAKSPRMMNSQELGLLAVEEILANDEEGDDAQEGMETYQNEASHAQGKEPAADPNRMISTQEMKQHCNEKSLWLAVDGLVRDCTTLVGFHPGGKQVLLSSDGSDMSDMFHASHLGPSYTVAKAHLASMPIIGLLERGGDNSSKRGWGGSTSQARPPSAPAAKPENPQVSVQQKQGQPGAGRSTRSLPCAADPAEQARALQEVKLAVHELNRGHREDVHDIGELRDAVKELATDIQVLSHNLAVLSPSVRSVNGSDVGGSRHGSAGGGASIPRLNLSGVAAAAEEPIQSQPGDGEPENGGPAQAPHEPMQRRATPTYTPRDVRLQMLARAKSGNSASKQTAQPQP